MIRTAILVGAALVAPRLADADVCHGGGGAPTYGSGNESVPIVAPPVRVYNPYPTGDDTETTAARREQRAEERLAEERCKERGDSDVLGFRECSKFGAWGSNPRVPHLFVELGMNVRQFTSGLTDRDASVSHGAETFSYRIVMPGGQTTRHADVAATTSVRASVGITHNLYAGLEGELGGLMSTANASTKMMSAGAFGTPNITQGSAMVLGGLAVAGVQGRVERGSIGVELAGGVRSVSYDFDSTYHDCAQTTTITSNRGVAEARARAELWLGPWVTAGATFGASMLERGDWMTGVYLGLHSRSYGASR